MSRLMQLGGGVMVLVFLPIFIVIALLFAALSGVSDASACTPASSDASSTFSFPVANQNPSARFQDDGGVQHHGVDFPAGAGEEVKSVANGTVTAVDGDLIKVRNEAPAQTPSPAAGDDLGESWYRYIRNPAVQVNQRVIPGQRLAEVGNSSGDANGAADNHLHFEVHVDGQARDPMDFFNAAPSQQSGACGCGGSATGSNNEQRAFNYFVSVGYTKDWAAGIVGNMIHESGVDPKKLNGGAVVSSQNVDLDGRAWGVVQWYPPRKMIQSSRDHGASWEQIDSLEYQLEFVWRQLEGTAIYANLPEVGDRLKRTTTPEDAAFVFARYYEIFSVDESDPEFDERRREARAVLDRWSGSAPEPGSATGASSCTGTVIQIDGRNYAFPFVRPKNDINNGYSWPCPSICHHDGSPAFDIAREPLDDSTAGTPVVAITDGHLENLNNAYAGIEGCQSFQLVGNDGWHYWYGHVANVSVRDGQTVTAGQAIAQVGPRPCTANGSYPHLHIDRGSPKGSAGGYDCCRDRGMVDLINTLYAALPDVS